MFYNGLDKALTIGLSDDALSKFNRPMSHNARKLLTRMLTWAAPKFAKDFNNSKAALFEEFSKIFDPTIYEWAVQRYDLSKYPGNGRAEAFQDAVVSAGPTNKDKVMRVLSLYNIQDDRWIESADIQSSNGYVGNILAEHTKQVYDLITTQFLVSDFNEHDLNRICELGATRIQLSTLRQHMSTINDPSKRSVPYLFAIARDSAIRSTFVKDAIAAEEQKQREALSRAIMYAGKPKLPYNSDVDYESAGDRAAAYAEILKELNDE